MDTVEVLCGWPHDGRHDTLLDEACGFIDSGDADRLIYLVPTADMARRVRREVLARTVRTAVTRVPVMTFNRLVARILGEIPPDPHRPYRVISSTEKLLLVERILSEQFRSKTSSRSPLATATGLRPMPGVVRRLARLIEELKRNLCPSGGALLESLGRARPVAPIDRAVAAVYDRYQTYLRDNALVDTEGTFFLVHETLDRCIGPLETTFPGASTLIVEGFRDFTSVESSILGRVAHGMDRTILAVDYVPAAGDLFTATEATYRFYCSLAGQTDVVCETDSPSLTATQRLWTDVLRRCTVGEGGAAPSHDARSSAVELTVCPDPRAEVAYVAESVKTLLLEGGYRDYPDKIAVVVPRTDGWTDVIEDQFSRYGIPMTVAALKPLGTSGPVRAVMAALQTRVRGYDRASLLSLIDNPYIAERPDPAVIGRHATALRITGGSAAAWLDPLRARAERLSTQAGPAGEIDHDSEPVRHEATRLETQGDALSRLLDALETIPMRAAPGEYRDSIMRIMDEPPAAVGTAVLAAGLLQSHPGVAAADARALEAFRELVDEVCAALERHSTRPIQLADMIEVLRTSISDAVYSATGPQPAGVAVHGIGDGVPGEYDHVFLAGLTDDAVPERSPYRVFFRRSDRQTSGYLRPVGPSVPRGWLAVVSAILSARETVHISWPTTGWDDKPAARSVYLEEIQDAADLVVTDRSDNTARPYADAELERSLGTLASASIRGRQDPAPLLDAGRELRRRHYPPLRTMAHATRAQCMRQVDTLGPYDGRIIETGLLDALRNRFAAGGHLFSVGQLESYASCPFKFFCDRVLRLDQPDEFREEASPAERGVVAHEIVRRFFTRWKAETGRSAVRPSDLESACSCLREEAETVLAASLGSIQGNVFWDSIRAEFTEGLGDESDRAGILRALIDTEIGADRQPDDRYLEWRFGHSAPGSGAADPRSVNTELRVPTNRRGAAGTVVPAAGAAPVRIAGKIDRVDVFGSADRRDYRLIDYKTSATVPPNKDVLSGESYQLGLYAVAAEEFLFGAADTLDGVGYYRLARADEVRVRNVKETQTATYDTMMDAVVSNVVDDVNSILHGYFYARGESETCRFCTFSRICRSDPTRLAKVSDPIIRRT